MKSIFTLCFALLFFAAQGFAQEPNRAEYQAKVYLNDNNIYVNKEMPIFLYFSTSEDAGAKKYLLNSKSTSEYANPMYLDTEGVNYIRTKWAVDKETKRTASPQQEVKFEMIADGLAPRTSSSFTSAPRYSSKGQIFYGKGLQVDLSARDAVSGIEGTRYSLNGTAYSNYGQSLSSFKEGNNELYYFSFDNVGNAEETNTRTFVYDISAPTTSNAIVGIQYGSLILAPSTKISLSSEDNLAGVQKISYALDEGSNRTYYSAVSLASLSDGDHTLYYFANDNVKNEESRKSIAFYLDRIPPNTEHAMQTDVCEKNGRNWISPRTSITLTSTDNKAGVNKTYYRIGRSMETVHGMERVDYASAFSIPDEYGFHVVKYDAMDNVENLGNNKFLKVYMDNAKPQTRITYGKPQFFTRDTLFINSKTNITLKATDKGSGVTKTNYKEDSKAMGEYSSSFNLDREGYRTLTFKSTDCVNNEETEKSSNAYVDNTPPVIYTNFSINAIGNKGGLDIYPNYTRLYIGATDKHVGNETIKYSINGEPFRLYSSPRTLDISELDRFAERKKYEVIIQAADKLGNQSEKKVEFYVGLED